MSYDRASFEQQICSNRESAIDFTRRCGGLLQYSLECSQRRVPISPTTFNPTDAYYSLFSSNPHHFKNVIFPLCGINNPAAAAAALVNLNAASGSPFNRASLSPPSPYKRKQGDGLSPVTTLSRPWLRPRSPGQPLKCPLCLISLEGCNITTHFVEEVHQLESLRTSDWETKDSLMSDVDTESNTEDYKRSRSLNDKMQPCNRWQTYQKVKQNRVHRSSGGVFRAKRFSDDREKIEPRSSPIKPSTNKGIWTIVDDIKEDKSSTENVDVETRSNSTEDDVEKKHDDKVESWLASSNVDHVSPLQKDKERVKRESE
ncbi:uncharacterized protein LOC141854404 isoform X3 [Brevipalpus obovatus]|uniref:uncharacterized protein LOC141854404 isoform X3 n=1 Tax=Brevipalpus obovatus TaxID=246614 RepID=UPI003D9DFD66